MFDLKDIRNNPEHYDAGWARRGLEAQTPTILELDEKRRGVQTKLQELQNARKVKSGEVGRIKSQKPNKNVMSLVVSVSDTNPNLDRLMIDVASLKNKMVDLEQLERDLSKQLHDILAGLPNIMDASVPDGADEDDNVEIFLFKDRQLADENHPDHVTIGETLGMMDFETAAKIAGARFVINNRGIAKLERALGQFMLDTHVDKNGYQEMSVPLLVNENAMYWSDKLPKFDNGYKTEDGFYLIPTSEVPLSCLYAEEIIEGDFEPKRFTAYTPCFRSEAGSAGRDTRGMLRQHQFYKVEMVSVTKPEDSEAEHMRMKDCAEGILEALDLPYRTVMLCSGDTGFGARKTYDLEVWMPGQGQYREISSCSNTGDFQARRMNARYRPSGEKKTEFVHTLNGSGLAVGRCLIAVMENYWDSESRSIIIPDVLKPYMGGVERISA